MAESASVPNAGLPSCSGETERIDLSPKPRPHAREARSYTIDYSGGGQYTSIVGHTKANQKAKKSANNKQHQRSGSGKEHQRTNSARASSSLRRSLSDPFINSWEFGHIDISAQFSVPGIGDLKSYFTKKFKSSTRLNTPKVLGSPNANSQKLETDASESAEEKAVFAERRRSSFAAVAGILLDHNEKGEPLILAASSSVLIKSLADKESHEPNFLDTVLLTHKYWTTTTDLVKGLADLYWDRGDKRLPDMSVPEFASVIKKRVVKVVQYWLDGYKLDFTNDAAAMDSLRLFVKEIIDHGSFQEKKWAEVLLDSMVNNATPQVSLTTNTDSPSPSKRGSKKRSKKSFDKRSPRKIQFLDVDPKLLAKQICIFDHKMLVKVAPSELFQSNWTKGKGENLSAIRERNTALAQWVASEIVTTPNIKQRVIVLSHFIELCLILYEARNFQSSYNIFIGLRVDHVIRLSKTWSAIDPKLLSQWQLLEQRLKSVSDIFEEACRAPSPKILPTNALLRQLRAREQDPEKHPALPDLVNFAKYRNIANVLLPIKEAQSCPYPYEEVPMLQLWLEKHLTNLESSKLAKLSMEIETEVSSSHMVSPRTKKNIIVQPKDKSSDTASAAPTSTAVGTPAKPIRARPELLEEIHLELISKWKRPLNKCSVGSDLPRFIRKIQVVDDNGKILYCAPTGDCEFNMVKEINTLLRCLAEQLDCKKELRAIDKQFDSYFVQSSQADLLKETGTFVNEVLGEDSLVTSLLKVSCSQGIISPAWVRLRLFILDKFPFKDARKGWRIYIKIEPYFITVCHVKKEMSSEFTMGRPNFDLRWELQMAFNRQMTELKESSLIISKATFLESLPISKRIELMTIVETWRGQPFRPRPDATSDESESSVIEPPPPVEQTTPNAKSTSSPKLQIIPPSDQSARPRPTSERFTNSSRMVSDQKVKKKGVERFTEKFKFPLLRRSKTSREQPPQIVAQKVTPGGITPRPGVAELKKETKFDLPDAGTSSDSDDLYQRYQTPPPPRSPHSQQQATTSPPSSKTNSPKSPHHRRRTSADSTALAITIGPSPPVQLTKRSASKEELSTKTLPKSRLELPKSVPKLERSRASSLGASKGKLKKSTTILRKQYSADSGPADSDDSSSDSESSNSSKNSSDSEYRRTSSDFYINKPEPSTHSRLNKDVRKSLELNLGHLKSALSVMEETDTEPETPSSSSGLASARGRMSNLSSARVTSPRVAAGGYDSIGDVDELVEAGMGRAVTARGGKTPRSHNGTLRSSHDGPVQSHSSPNITPTGKAYKKKRYRAGSAAEAARDTINQTGGGEEVESPGSSAKTSPHEKDEKDKDKDRTTRDKERSSSKKKKGTSSGEGKDGAVSPHSSRKRSGKSSSPRHHDQNKISNTSTGSGSTTPTTTPSSSLKSSASASSLIVSKRGGVFGAGGQSLMSDDEIWDVTDPEVSEDAEVHG